MVKLFITVLFIHLIIVCQGQEITPGNKIELNSSFSSDVVYMEDSLELILIYRNTSNYNFNLYPKAIFY